MRAVSVTDGLVSIGAGARLGEVYTTLLGFQQTIPAGTCPSVGVAGLTLGGGLGMLGRTQGLTSDHLVAARIVRADGRLLLCDEHHESDLFWALRGAGAGNFGVVTELVFRPMPVPPVVTTFSVIWPYSHARQMVEAWIDWIGTAPDVLAASLDLKASGNVDEPPVVELYGSMLGTRSELSAALDPVTVQAGAPIEESVNEGSYRDALHYWAARAGEQLEDPRAESGIRPHEVIKSGFFARRPTPDAIAAVVENFAAYRRGAESRNVDFSPWGGAYTQLTAHATAFVHRDALYWIKHTAALPTDPPRSAREAAKRWVNRSWQAVKEWGTGGVFPNFPDPDLEDWGRAYYGSNYERLVEIKAHVDPGNVFSFRQSLPLG
jgi:FAD/FMN-containing dehydrogenase